MMQDHLRTSGFVLLLTIPALAQAQGGPKAQACFFSADFEDGLIPAGWDIGPLVERQTSEGDSLGEFVPAWTVGTSTDANANGSFPVTDIPVGNHFIMANDDAAPCNCTMADVALTTGGIDLTGRTNVWLEGRSFNAQLAGGDTATVEVSADGASWDTVLVVPPANDWTSILADLSAYDGQPALLLRFRWSDGGTWAGGFAVDDICLRERLPNDLSVIDVTTGGSAGPFQAGDQTLHYSLLPLEQAGTLTPGVQLMNRGASTATDVNITVTITQNGTDVYDSPPLPLGNIPTGGPATWYWIDTDWSPTETGEVIVSFTVSCTVDDDHSDNSGAAILGITGPGWDNGYGAMACDEDQMQGAIGGSSNFIAANRMEIIHEGSTARGISAVITSSSQLGEQVRAILMDANFAFVDSSSRHTLTEEDLYNGWLGGALYLPLNAAPVLAPGDYHVGMQRLAGTGDVFLATSGTSALGAAVLMEGPTFDITYLTGTPMVRLHLADYGVGIAEDDRITLAVNVFPVPASDAITVAFGLPTTTRVHAEVIDPMGRVVMVEEMGVLPSGQQNRRLSVSGLAPGCYSLRVITPVGTSEQRFIVAR